jgi:hypothetical protein
MTTKEKFNAEYEDLYKRLQKKIDEKTLNSIKGRMFAHRKAIDQFDLSESLKNVKSEREVYKIFDKLNSLSNELDSTSTKKTEVDILIDKFPKKFQKTIKEIVKIEKVSTDVLTNVYERISNYILAIEAQNRDEEIVNAKTIEQVEDTLKRVELVSRANKWSDLIPHKYRAQVKKQLEKFADIISDFSDYDDYKKSFMKKANVYSNAKSFFDGLVKFVEGSKDGIDEIIAKINSVEGAEIETINENVIIAWIYTKKASVKLGSSQWCISYSGSSNYFNSYVFNSMNKQYFVWNLTKSPSSNEYRVGVTLNAEGIPSHAHLKNDSSCLSNIKSYSWYKYLKPMSHKQMRTWIKYLSLNNIKFPNSEIALYASIEDNDFELFKNIVDGNYSTFANNKMTMTKIMKLLIDNDFIDYIKYLSDKSNGVISGMGQMFIYSYEQKKENIFNYFRNLITPDLLNLITKISKTFPEYKKFIEYYNKTA